MLGLPARTFCHCNGNEGKAALIAAADDENDNDIGDDDAVVDDDAFVDDDAVVGDGDTKEHVPTAYGQPSVVILAGMPRQCSDRRSLYDAQACICSPCSTCTNVFHTEIQIQARVVNCLEHIHKTTLIWTSHIPFTSLPWLYFI